MVRGVEKFKEYFRDYTGQYTFIGGTACDIILGNLGEEFRATKDLDMVLILEELSEEFANTLMTRLGPLHISDDVVSLSAILLDDEYYELLKSGIVEVGEVSVLDLVHIILFKVKAWLDLSERKEKGEHIDSKNIKKHKNDILRLGASLEKGSTFSVAGRVREDVEIFINKIEKEPIDPRSLDIRNATFDELLDSIKICYGIE